jgi:hypothetical protein
MVGVHGWVCALTGKSPDNDNTSLSLRLNPQTREHSGATLFDFENHKMLKHRVITLF